MRNQFVQTLKAVLRKDSKTTLLLGDIGVFAFREELANLEGRAINIGILEQSTIGVAAGMSKVGLIPTVHTIAPFLVERTLEQLKIDFGYQNLNGNFVSVGASYDYAALGCTHHCPADVITLLNIPNMQVIVPGSSAEFDIFFKEAYNNGSPTYFRLSEKENNYTPFMPEFGKAIQIQEGSKATIICIGNTLSDVEIACTDLDVTILYYTSLEPFDKEMLRRNFNSQIITVEPFYKGSFNHILTGVLENRQYNIHNIGVPRKFLTNYGTRKEHDISVGLDCVGIRNQVLACIK